MRRKIMGLVLGMTFCVGLVCEPARVGSAPVAAPPPAAAPPTPALPSISPFLDDRTFLVAAIDVSAFDPEATLGWAVTMLKAGQSSQKEIDGATYALRGLVPPAKKWIGDFGRAGGRYLLIVISSDPAAPVLLTTPADGRVNLAALTELMRSPLGVKLPGSAPAVASKPGVAQPKGTALPAMGFQVERIGQSLVVGTTPTLQKARLLAGKAEQSTDKNPRPEFAAALANTAGGIRIAAGLTKDLRDGLAAIGPNLPAELGGEPTAVLTQRLNWAALSIDLPSGTQPKAAVRLTLQAADADSANRLKNIMAATFRTAANDGELAKHPDKDKVLKMLEPKLDANRLSVVLDQKDLKESAGIFGPLALKARLKAAGEQSETHLKQIVQAIRNATDEAHGKLPKSLEDPIVLKYLGDTPAKAKEILTNPISPERGLGYVYIRPPTGTPPVETILVYEAYDTWPAAGIRAGFTDGHTEDIKSEAELKKRLMGK